MYVDMYVDKIGPNVGIASLICERSSRHLCSVEFQSSVSYVTVRPYIGQNYAIREKSNPKFI
jgi:hypothetical protein